MSNALSSFSSGGVSGVYDFAVTGAPPFTQLKVHVNGVDYTKMVAPADYGYTIGQPLVTDASGYAAGKLIIIKAYGQLVADGDFEIVFLDVSNNEQISYGRISYNTPADSDINNPRPSITLGSKTGSAAANNTNDIPTIGVPDKSFTTPLTQTFYVDGVKYPDGVLVTSINLFFSSKDATMPVGIQLRKVVNGFPSTTECIADSIDVLTPDQVSVPANPTNGPAVPTTFKVHCALPPGEYAICVLTGSSYYGLYYADYGLANSPISNSFNNLATREPYVGKFYKPQSYLWMEEKNRSICFELKIARFQSGLFNTFEVRTETVPLTYYDSIYLDSTEINPTKYSSVSWKFKGKSAATSVMDNYMDIKSNTPVNLMADKKLQDAGDIVLEGNFVNGSYYTSPIIDKSKLTLYTVKNLIDPYSAELRASELLPQNGNAKSRYISKIVSLDEAFSSTGLEVKLDVNRKYGTDIDVFCRVMSPQDINRDNNIENLPWRRMPLFNQRANAANPSSLEGEKTYVGMSDTFVTETYKILEQDSEATTGISNLYYEVDVGGVTTTFKDFNKFQIKVVMYSSDSSIVPKFKNLIATAVI